MDHPDSKVAILVLGFPRSGTSAVSALIAEAGVNFGKPEHFLDPAVHKHNPAFFELVWVNQLNDCIYQSWGGSWPDCILPVEADFESEAIASIRNDLAAAIEQEWQAARMLGTKDPRLSVTFPAWKPVLLSRGFRIKCVHVLRTPAAAIASNAALDPSQPLEHWHHFWLRYNLAARYFTRNEDTLYVDYEDLMESPELEAARLFDRLGLHVDDVAQAVGPLKRQHQHHDRQKRSGNLLVDRVYRELKRGTLEHEEYLAYREAALYHRRVERAAHRDWSAQLSLSLARQEQRVAEQHQETVAYVARIADLEAQLAGHQAQLAGHQAQLAAQQAEIVARHAENQEKETRLSELQAETDAQRYAAQHLKEQLQSITALLQEKEDQIRSMSEPLALLPQKDEQVRDLEARLAGREDELRTIHLSRAWRVITGYRQARGNASYRMGRLGRSTAEVLRAPIALFRRQPANEADSESRAA